MLDGPPLVSISECLMDASGQEESVFQTWQSHDDLPLFASREEHVKFIELQTKQTKTGPA